MMKKALLGVALFGLIGILVVGAVRRTMDRTSQTSNSQGGHGRGQSAEARIAAEAERQGGYQQRGNHNNPGQTNGNEESHNLGEAAGEEWVTYEGAVVALDDEMLTVRLDDGERLAIEGRSWSYAQEQGLVAGIGDRLALMGFYEGDTLQIGQIDNITTGQTVVLREQSGRPLWAGHGRRNA